MTDQAFLTLLILYGSFAILALVWLVRFFIKDERR